MDQMKFVENSLSKIWRNIPSSFLKEIFHKFYLVHSWMLCHMSSWRTGAFYVFCGIKDLFCDRPSHTKFSKFLLSPERRLSSIVCTFKRFRYYELLSWKNKKSDGNLPWFLCFLLYILRPYITHFEILHYACGASFKLS